MLGYSSKNKPISNNADEMWYIYKFEWRFDLILRNNSEVNAYVVKLLQHKARPQIQFRGEINMLKALKSQEEIILPFRVHNIVECQGKNREEHFRNTPPFFKDLMIVFDYKNPKGNSFQSRYYFNTNITDFQKIKGSEIKKYWR